jgi:FKBP-type peptidyl-prolyl cis-trans isomerase 2
MAPALRRDVDAFSSIRQVIAVVIVIGLLVGLFLIFFVQRPVPAAAQKRAEPGDSVTIDYIGSFEDTGRVFDTSFERVARDNVSYPKAASFSWRAQWQNFAFDVGCSDLPPAQQAIVKCTASIKGFDYGVREMTVGESKRVIVPPEDGYGPLDPRKVFERPLLQEVPARVVMNETAFQDTYGTTPSEGLIVKDPVWAWNTTVSVSGNVITVTNSPYIGERVRPYHAWNARVTQIDDAANNGSGIVYVLHDLRPEDAGTILARDGANEFTVPTVDVARGVYVADYNREVVGRTLVFDITVVSIVRA